MKIVLRIWIGLIHLNLHHLLIIIRGRRKPMDQELLKVKLRRKLFVIVKISCLASTIPNSLQSIMLKTLQEIDSVESLDFRHFKEKLQTFLLSSLKVRVYSVCFFPKALGQLVRLS